MSSFSSASDLKLFLLVAYSFIFIGLQPLSPKGTQLVHFLHALSWRLFHSFGLGLLLKAQSDSKWMVRHYVKHYYYPPGSPTGAIEEAFDNWKGLYNLSSCMTYSPSCPRPVCVCLRTMLITLVLDVRSLVRWTGVEHI